MKGTIRYMAPEQVSGDKNIDRRADVFSVGVMLWEALAGRRMWGDRSDHEVLLSLVKGEIPTPVRGVSEAPPPALEVAARATAAHPARRFDTALEMQLELERCLDALGGPVRQREVSEFMRREYGKSREERRRAIAEAARDRSTNDLLEPTPASGIQTLGASTSERIVTLEAPPPGRRWWPAVALAAVASVALVLGVRSSAPPDTRTLAGAAPEPAPRQIALEVVASPLEAEILLDGKLVGRGAIQERREAAGGVSTLEGRAPGDAPDARVVSVDKDVSVEVALRPLVVAAPPVVRAPADGAKSAHRAPPAPSPPQRKSAASPASRALPAASGAPSVKEGCNPPYSLSPDGVKTYKPECF